MAASGRIGERGKHRDAVQDVGHGEGCRGQSGGRLAGIGITFQPPFPRKRETSV